MKRLALLLVIAALALAGCSSKSSGGDQVASLTGDGATTSSSPTTGNLSDEEAAAEFGKCMRANGMPDFPDPTVDENGVRFNGDPQTYMSRPAAQTAMSTCDHFIAAVQQRFNKQNPGAMQDSMQAMVACLRKKGYEVPDPSVGDDGSIRINEPAGSDHDAFTQAMQYCQTHPAPAGGQGS